jgi:hypothetical protein
MPSLLAALAGAAERGSKGLGRLADLKLRQEAEETQFLRQQNLERFRATQQSLLQKERQEFQAGESKLEREALQTRHEETTESRLEAAEMQADATSEAARLKREARQQELKDAPTRAVETLRAVESEKKKIALKDLKDTIKIAFPDATPEEQQSILSAIKREQFAGGKQVPASVKADLYFKAREAADAAGFLPESPNYSKHVNKFYEDSLKAIDTERSVGLLGVPAGEPKVPTGLPTKRDTSTEGIADVLSRVPAGPQRSEITKELTKEAKSSRDKRRVKDAMLVADLVDAYFEDDIGGSGGVQVSAFLNKLKGVPVRKQEQLRKKALSIYKKERKGLQQAERQGLLDLR